VEKHALKVIEDFSQSDDNQEPILGRLKPPSQDVRQMLQDAVDATEEDVEPTNPQLGMPYSLVSWDKQVWFQTLEDMKKGGAELALRDERHGGVTLNVRTQQEGILHVACEGIKTEAEMDKICPQSTFSFGQGGSDNADPRYYMIVAWGEALTRTHCDPGAQAVMYHTHRGVNLFVGLSSRCAAVIQAACDCLSSKHFEAYDVSARLEGRALRLLGLKGLLQYSELRPGETLLILPRAGHVVLAGNEGKTVYAGEWWHRGVGQKHRKGRVPAAHSQKTKKARNQ